MEMIKGSKRMANTVPREMGNSHLAVNVQAHVVMLGSIEDVLASCAIYAFTKGLFSLDSYRGRELVYARSLHLLVMRESRGIRNEQAP